MPPPKKEKPRYNLISARLNDEEYSEVRAKAAALGVKVSQYALSKLLA